MTISKIFATPAVLLLSAAIALGACSTSQVADVTGDAVGLAGKATVHTVAGAGKLVYRGGRAAVNAAVN